jgi:hypothetical protein
MFKINFLNEFRKISKFLVLWVEGATPIQPTTILVSFIVTYRYAGFWVEIYWNGFIQYTPGCSGLVRGCTLTP